MNKNLRSGLRGALVLLAVCLAFAAPARAQVAETAAQVGGQVTDAAGAAVAGATVVVRNTATGEERRAQTSEDGIYAVPQLSPGSYVVTVEQAGFKRTEVSIVLNAADRRPLDILLEAGNVSETVLVTSEQTLTQDSPTGQALISGTQVVELPLKDRNFIRLVEAGIPGITSDLDDADNFGLTSRASISINGMRRNAVNYFVDGVSNTDVGSNITLLSTPTVDSIQEFKVLSSNYTAEIGRSGGGAITVVTRGGTNEYHGSLYEFNRNNKFSANTFFNNRIPRLPNGEVSPTAQVPKLRYNNFGGTLGGPLPFLNFGEGGRWWDSGKNKTFFFFSEEQRRISRGTTESSATVPNAALRGGDLSALLGLPLFRSTSAATPACTTPGTGTCTTTPFTAVDTAGNTVQLRQNQVFRRSDNRPYANNVIPASDIDPRSLALLAAYPQPNTGTFGFTFSPVNVSDTRQETLRIDRVINDNHRVFGRYTHDLGRTAESFGLFGPFCTLPGFCNTDTEVPGQVLAFSWNGVFSSTFVNEATFNYSANRITSLLAGNAQRANFPGTEQIAEAFSGNPTGIVPTITGNGFNTIGAAQDYFVKYDNKVVRDVATWTRGNHVVKFGGEASWEKKVENGRNAAQGSFAFSAIQSQGLTGAVVINGTGSSFGSFLLGRANSYSEAERDIFVNVLFGRREAFFQDTWKVRPNVTLDLGVRYQFFTPPIDENNQLSSFDTSRYKRSDIVCTTAACTAFSAASPNPLTGIYIAGKDSPFGRAINKADKNNFSPRVGLAYSPQFESGLGRLLFGAPNKSVVRLGYGFYYDQPLVGIFELPGLVNVPFVISASYTSTTADVITFSNPTAGTTASTIPVRSLQAIAPDFTTPETSQWSLGIQREIFQNAVIDLSYVGTKGDHLIRRRNINFQLPADIVQVGTANAGQVRPFVGYGAITYYETSAKSRYHGLLSSFNYRFGNGFTVTAAYTFSKNMTDSTNDRDAVDDPQNSFNLRPEYAEARTSRPHVFSASYVYEIPFFRNDSSAWKRVLLGGYQIAGITNLESGAPVPRVTISDTLSGQRGLYPNVVSDPNGGLAGTRDASGLPYIFDPTAFTPAPNGTFGNAARAFARLPGRNQTNLSLAKNIYFNTEKKRYLQLRAESFNVFNHTQFTLIGTTYTTTLPDIKTGTLGRPTSTRLPREFQFGAKFYF
ncbi:MAG TPA: carboxypeptidase regulatory-like domain-containing protein [Pyrinomonadaceae bacterium]|nr:carboxypeptidase regulatory-like domain-containing protein [Pyrinomonadaceae bacterium]